MLDTIPNITRQTGDEASHQNITSLPAKPTAQDTSKAIDARERSFGQTLNMWVQTIGIIVAAAWGGYTFIYKEITIPKSAPINITMNLQLKKISSPNPEKRLVAVEMQVTATNPASRTLYLLPSLWIVRGFKIASSDANPDFNSHLEALINAQEGQYTHREVATRSSTIVAGGSLFSDNWLNPRETVTRNIVFYVSRSEKYDKLEVVTLMPCAEQGDKIELQWIAIDKDSLVSKLYYPTNDGGERKPLKEGEEDLYGYQTVQSRAEISLWQ